jgi:predicted nucleic acid-binding protein
LIGHIDLLPTLFRTVAVPPIVMDELLHPSAPQAVRAWAGRPPPWLMIDPAPPPELPADRRLDAGENAAIDLALGLKKALLLMDDRAGVAVARARRLAVIGTLGVLAVAADRQIIDIADAAARLNATNFRYKAVILDALVDRYRRSSG